MKVKHVILIPRKQECNRAVRTEYLIFVIYITIQI